LIKVAFKAAQARKRSLSEETEHQSLLDTFFLVKKKHPFG